MKPSRSAANAASLVQASGRPRRSPFVVAALLTFGGLASACGSSSSSSSPATSGALASACSTVSAVLSDGPDPGADPVGYAEAQILPLRQIHTSDKALQTAIDSLASAYQQVSSTNGAATATHAATEAGNKVNAICPGAAS
jgi:hypothetical protein